MRVVPDVDGWPKMNNKSIVLLVTIEPVPKTRYGGPGAVVYQLAKGLSKLNKNFKVTVVASHYNSGHETTTTFPIVLKKLTKFLRKLKSYRYFKSSLLYRNLRSKLRTFKVFINYRVKNWDDIGLIHCHDIFSYFCIKSILFERQISKPILLSIHSSGSTAKEMLDKLDFKVAPWLKRWLGEFEKTCIKDCSLLVLGSNAAKDYLKKDFPYISSLIEKKSMILYNGIEDAIPGTKEKIREKLCLKRMFICVSVGRLLRIKGFDVLIKAVSLLPKPDNVHLLIVGDGPEMETLKSLAYKSGLSNKVHFLGFRKDVPEIHAVSNIYVSSSRAAMFDLSLLEAMRAGLPIIASRMGGNIEALGEKAGILVDLKPEEFAKAINNLKRDRKQMRKLGRKARSRFIRFFTTESMARKAVEIYEQFLN